MVDYEEIFNGALETPNDDNAIAQTMRLLAENDENIDLKSEINEPMKLAVWDMLIEYWENRGLKQTANMAKLLKTKYIINMVSYKRKSRKEMIQALQSINAHEEEQSKIERLLNKQR